MAVRTKNYTELRVAEAKLPIMIYGRKYRVWIDSGSPVSIFTINELRRTLGAVGIKLQEVETRDQEFRDYGNNPINLLGTMKVELASNGWTTSAVLKVIEGARPSIIGRDLMPHLGLSYYRGSQGKMCCRYSKQLGRKGKINWRSGRTISVIYFLVFLNGWGVGKIQN